jgi:deoxyadenosine/deoxycytidine kinase
VERHLAIAGNIGVGKSTLTRMLSRRLGWEAVYEAVDENPYLADFYQDMRRWSFHSQIFFLSRRLAHYREILDRAGYVIQDRSVYEDAEIFARNLYLQGQMHDRDYDCYDALYQAIVTILPAPDLVIYLRASVPTLMKRIALRGRDFEQGISPSYIERLNQLYESWIAGFNLCPILTVPGDEIDFVQRPADLDLIVNQVQAKLRGDQLALFPEGTSWTRAQPRREDREASP